MKNINNESEFEDHLRKDILTAALTPNFRLFDSKKAVDILIAKNGNDKALFFIEIKYHKQKHGRLGFGQGKGRGFQPEILKTKSDYFENNLMWILGIESSELYWFVNNATIRKYLNGDSIGEKYNGIKKSFFSECKGISKDQLIIELKQWLQ